MSDLPYVSKAMDGKNLALGASHTAHWVAVSPKNVRREVNKRWDTKRTI